MVGDSSRHGDVSRELAVLDPPPGDTAAPTSQAGITSDSPEVTDERDGRCCLEPGDSDWAELRETQTKTLRLPNTGQAVIIDLGEGRDIHPRNKHDVAARLVRWALVKDYGKKLPYRSPEYKSSAFGAGSVTVTFDCFGSTLRAFDVPEVRGFAVCGEDRVWHWATGKVVGKDSVELACAAVPQPIAVRYAWADNPVCNLYSLDGLPVTPFRTDSFEMITKPKPPVAAAKQP